MSTETGIETQLKEAVQLSEAVWAVLAERVSGDWFHLAWLVEGIIPAR